MPPKVAAAPVGPVGKKITLSVTVSKPFDDRDILAADAEGNPLPPLKEGIRLRTFATWADCAMMSPLFGDRSAGLGWKAEESHDSHHVEAKEEEKSSLHQKKSSSSLTFVFGKDVKGLDQIRSFHEDAGIYFLFSHVNEQTVAIANLFHIDCSCFLLYNQDIQLHRKVFKDYEVDIKLSIEESFTNWTELLPLEPVVLRLKNVNSYPIFANEDHQTAMDGTYLYGVLKLGPTMHRKLLAFPSTLPLANTSSSQVDKYPLDLRICLLPGLADLAYFRDIMAASTFAVEVHQDDIVTRSFNDKFMEEYLVLLSNEPGGLALPGAAAAAAPAAGGKKAPAKGAPAAVAEVPAFAPTPAAIAASDKLVISTLFDNLPHSKEIRPHGSARFRLEQLLEKSSDLLKKFQRKRQPHGDHADDDHVVVKEDMAVEVRLEKPSKPEKWDLPADMSLIKALEKAKISPKVVAVKNPPRFERYLVAGTTLTITAELHRKLDPEVTQIDSESPYHTQKLGKTIALGVHTDEPRDLSEEELQKILHETPFTRMIIMFKYIDDETLRSINEGLDAVNSRALPDIQGSIRSYTLTEREKEDAISGKLDVLSGYMVIDDDMRMVVLEGLAAPDCGMEWLYTDFLPKVKDNDDSLKILCNPEVLFPDRIYPDYSPDLRRIRVRGKLKKLARRPEVYNRKQVEEICFSAIDGLMALSRAEDVLSTKQLDMYPPIESLNKLELLYGEAITRSDMDGTLKKEFLKTFEDRKSRDGPSTASRPATQAEEATLTNTAYLRKHGEFVPTDCRNPDFEHYLQTRPAHRINHMDEHRRLRKQAWSNMLHRRDTRAQQYRETIKRVLGRDVDTEGAPKIFLYSTQSQNFKAKAWAEMRHRVADDNSATYTFSQTYLSQTVSVVDDAEEKKKNEEYEKSQRLTQKGFLYPKPKTRKELIEHAKKPSEARVEELQEPFMDSTDIKGGVAAQAADPYMLERERGFQTQIKGGSLFGGMHLPEYERDFQLKLVGHRTELPRGEQVNANSKNPHFFRSVHLGGENQARIVEEAILKEKEEWKSKLVVDDIAFKVGGFKVRDKAIPVDRYKDILKDAPKKEVLKTIRDRTSHRGADFSYTTTPLSIMLNEPYNPNAASLARKLDSTKFVTAEFTDDGKHNAKDFTRYIHKDTDKPSSISMISKRKHPTQDKHSDPECKGAKWEAAHHHNNL